jgi:hypothetical protein
MKAEIKITVSVFMIMLAIATLIALLSSGYTQPLARYRFDNAYDVCRLQSQACPAVAVNLSILR